VLIGRQGALCGNINYASGRFWASEHAVVAHPRGEFNLVWFGELLRTMNLNRYSIAAAQPGLAVERIQDLPLPVPPVEEQTRIGRYLDVFASEIDEAVQCARRGIDLLREYRTRLIADVVTGKLDVREAAANLPDEAEEPEPLADEDLLTGESEVDDQGQEEAALEEIEA
jgi:type I restriction enzyme S subunit